MIDGRQLGALTIVDVSTRERLAVKAVPCWQGSQGGDPERFSPGAIAKPFELPILNPTVHQKVHQAGSL